MNRLSDGKIRENNKNTVNILLIKYLNVGLMPRENKNIRRKNFLTMTGLKPTLFIFFRGQ